jgi:hypothetical protein
MSLYNKINKTTKAVDDSVDDSILDSVHNSVNNKLKSYEFK